MKKLQDRYSTQIEAEDGKWWKVGEYDTLREASQKAAEVCDKNKTRVVRYERTLIKTYESKGKKVKSIQIAFTSNGLKTFKQYA